MEIHGVKADPSRMTTTGFWRERWTHRLGVVRPSRADVAHAVLDAAAGLAIAVVTWPVAEASPSIAIDPSWIVGLQLAARQRLQFGHDIVFTYGPLGFLGFSQPYLGWTSAAAFLFVGAVHLFACIGLFHLARRAIGGPAALIQYRGRDDRSRSPAIPAGFRDSRRRRLPVTLGCIRAAPGRSGRVRAGSA